ncbi:hypothetical protein [Paenibacillus sp. FSL L8-0638]
MGEQFLIDSQVSSWRDRVCSSVSYGDIGMLNIPVYGEVLMYGSVPREPG